MPRIATLSVYLLVLKRVRRDIRDSRNGGHCQIVCWHSEADCAESKSEQMCEIRLTKLPYAAQQVGIVHFYAVAEIKGLSCRLRWMDEWRNLLTSTHVGHRLCHVGSREHRSVTPKFVTPTAPSYIDNSWRSTTLPGADSASSNQTLPFQNEHEWVLEKLR